MDVNSGNISAHYEWPPFGETIRATGPMAKINHFRFSTKYQDDETSLLYYGYRYYQPTTGRWPSRDPIGERGGVNIYAFLPNSPVNIVDLLGLLSLQETADKVSLNRPAGTADGLTPGLMLCLLWKESSFNENAGNPTSSARGIAQILNGTADQIQDHLAPAFGISSDPFYTLAPHQRLRANRLNPDVSIYAAYIYLDHGVHTTGSVGGAVNAYGPGGNLVIKCSKCCGILHFDKDGVLLNQDQVWKCLHLIHH
jgi:RHS repeat-associated protein